jgi:Cupin-like domain
MGRMLSAARGHAIARLPEGEQRNDQYRAAVAEGRPVALSLGAEDCSFVRWNTSWLAERAGASDITVYSSDRPSFGLGTDAVVNTHQMALSAYLDIVRESPSGLHEGRHLYLRQVDVDDLRFRDDADGTPGQADWITNSHPVARRNLWIGGTGTRTPLHFDLVDNLYVQAQGRKTVRLVPPAELDLVYPHPPQTRAYQTSMVDWLDVDTERFPRAEQASVRSITLQPGDGLLIPAFWWHELESDEPTVSVNIWWRAPLSRCLVPGLARRIIRIRAEHGVFAVARSLHSAFELDGPTWASTLIGRLLDEGSALLAILLSEAVLAHALLRGHRATTGSAERGRQSEAEAGLAVRDLAVDVTPSAECGAAVTAVLDLADEARASIDEGRAPSWNDDDAIEVGRGGLRALRHVAVVSNAAVKS